MRLAFVIVAIIFCSCTTHKNKPDPKGWTQENERNFRRYLDSDMRESIPDSAEREEYNEFFTERFKEGIPNGWNSVSKDSLKSLNIRISREYILKRKHEGKPDLKSRRVYNAWSPFIEKSFRENYLAIFEKYTKPSINAFCDCMLKKFKMIYPDSILIPIPGDINNKAALECKSILVEK